jgi:hypothetical protein
VRLGGRLVGGGSYLGAGFRVSVAAGAGWRKRMRERVLATGRFRIGRMGRTAAAAAGASASPASAAADVRRLRRAWAGAAERAARPAAPRQALRAAPARAAGRAWVATHTGAAAAIEKADMLRG